MKIVGFPCSVDMSVGGRREVMVGVFLHDNVVRKRPESVGIFAKVAFHENLTRARLAAVLLVENYYDVPRSTQPDQSKSSLVSGPIKFFGPSVGSGTNMGHGTCQIL